MDQSVHREPGNSVATDGSTANTATTSSAVAGGGLSHSASTSSLPKLRLTLKVATPVPEQPTDPAKSGPQSGKKRKTAGAKVGKPRLRGPNKLKQPPVEQGRAAPASQGQNPAKEQACANGSTVTGRYIFIFICTAAVTLLIE
jgi:hypothetical protein